MSIEGFSFSPSAISKYARFAVIHYLESGQVTPANLVIEAAVKSKGINADRLVKWMSHVIQHKFDPKTKRFGKKYKRKKTTLPAEAFIAENPDFYKWRPTDEDKIEYKGKSIPENKRNQHVKALRSSASEILKCKHKSLTSSEIKTIENVISDLNSMVNGIRLVRGTTAKTEVKAHFVSGGLPSLGKKRK